MQEYTCPMHPEVVSDKPGRCPKCGMALVLKQDVPLKVYKTEDKGLGALTWRSYMPLIVIIFLIAVVSLVIARGSGVFNFITNFMSGFFLVFAGFKLMDLKGFAEGYSTYDLLAQKVPAYGYIYPFIELFFGLAMIVVPFSKSLLIAELVVMAFSGLGVAIKLWKREPFICACLGTFLKVPLTKITLIEDFGMVLLASIMLLK